ncbi:MAG: sulfotransferase family protein [Planctomycetota bacterium]|nr:MAG: sulfotransferase family protein [Planctomycetota bacterium]REK29056.1 MAG: sulfotransferase family protein [Planctomycetota bacterium]REK46623.1 MAG: sulfotransferase family protein [Planctomycetota bacterium]
MTAWFAAWRVTTIEVSLDNRSSACRSPMSDPTNHRELQRLCCELVEARRYDEAEACCRRYLAVRPDEAEAYFLLGNVCEAASDLAGAVAAVDQAVSRRPDEPSWHSYLGSLYARLGDTARAIECFRRCLALAPHDAAVRNNLGVALRRHGQHREAIACLEELVRDAPQFALGYRNLGEVLLELGRREEAIAIYQRLLQLVPDDPETHNALGVVLVADGKPGEAIAHFESALRSQPGYVDALLNLTSVLKSVGRLDEALARCQEAIRLAPQTAVVYVTLGTIYRARRDLPQALEAQRRALQLDPQNPEAHNNLATVLTDLGQFEEAISESQRALELRPDYIPAFAQLSDLARQKQYDFADSELRQMEAIAAAAKAPPDEVAQLHFILGGIAHRQGRHDDAFRAYRAANDQRQALLEAVGRQFDPQLHRRKVDKILATFDAAYFAGLEMHGSASDVPVFVVGMPRSGTSLVEQIIASHPDAAGAGELTEISTFAERILAAIPDEPSRGTNRPLFEQVTLEHAASQYLARITASRPGVRRVVDKMWANFTFLGLIATLFPQARIVHCRRHLLDIALSCYFQDFSYIDWAWRLEDIAHYLQQYLRIMDHWRAVLPMTMLELSYEEMVEDQEAQTRRLIEFCDLPWRDECLEFYATDRPVYTASRVQVRQPIYRSSLAKWQKYAAHLEAVQVAVEGTG